jgi:aspartate aminotransferase
MVRARALEAQGRDVIHLEIGEPDFDTPANVSEAGVAAIREGWTHYGPASGQPDLRQTIADYINRSRGTSYGPANVVVTPGGKPIMFFLILALLEEGDDAIFPDPGFPIYRSMMDFVGARAIPLPIREELDFRLDVNELAALITPQTKFLIINSPANPTGGVLTREDLEAIAALAVQHDLFVLADEIYSEIIYDGDHHSIATFPGLPERTAILDGFSKTYAMTGWRMGYGVMPAWIAEQVTRLAVNCNSCTPGFSQLAALAALTGPQDAVDQMVAEFRRRRDAMVAGLNAIPGISCLTPNGAFYVFPNISALGADSKTIATRLLDEGGVALLWGSAFGAAGEGYLRLSYANSLENIELALDRIRHTVETMA